MGDGPDWGYVTAARAAAAAAAAIAALLGGGGLCLGLGGGCLGGGLGGGGLCLGLGGGRLGGGLGGGGLCGGGPVQTNSQYQRIYKGSPISHSNCIEPTNHCRSVRFFIVHKVHFMHS